MERIIATVRTDCFKISVSLLIAFLFNWLLFKLDLILSLIFCIILCLLLYIHFNNYDEEYYGNIKEKISLVLISESIIISFKDFYYKKTNFIFFTRNIKVTISPNMITLIVSIFYALSICLRNRIPISDKPKDIAFNVLNILFFSSLLSVLISNDYFYIPIYGETSFSYQAFFIFLLVLSWVGMKSINIFIFPLLALLALGRIGEVNKAMGIVGLFYLLFSYTSIYLQFSGNKTINKIYKNSLSEFSSDFKFKENLSTNYSQVKEPLIEKNK